MPRALCFAAVLALVMGSWPGPAPPLSPELPLDDAPDDAPRANAGSLLHERLRSLDADERALVELASLAGDALPVRVLLDAAGMRDRRRLGSLWRRRRGRCSQLHSGS